MTIETKYDVGGKAWVMYNDKPKEITINKITISTTRKGIEIMYWFFPLDGHYNVEYEWDEDEIFPSKESLIQHLAK